jgi:hypothetical protein
MERGLISSPQREPNIATWSWTSRENGKRRIAGTVCQHWAGLVDD